MNKGILYEIQIYKYLIDNYKNYNSYLWKDVPFQYIFKCGLNNLISFIDDELIKKNDNINNAIDIGCDILMVNKDNEDDIILVQCKNYLDKNVCIKDIAGFSFLMAFSHIPIRGLLISNSDCSNRIKYKFELCSQYINDKIKFIQVPYIDTINEILQLSPSKFIPYEYQLDALAIIAKPENQKCIMQMPCGMGKTFIAIMLSKLFDNIIVLTPLRAYAQQLINNFKFHLADLDYNIVLVSMDGYRDSEFLLNNICSKNIFIATYNSVDIINTLLDKLNNSLLIVDEFHNLSYNNITNTEDQIYKLITTRKINKKLFISATPKIYEIIDENNVNEHSVNNYENIFGKIVYSYDLNMAIQNNYINNYQIIIPNNETENDQIEFIYSNMLYYGYKKCLIYCKCVEECEITKTKLEEINKTKYNFNLFNEIITYKTSGRKRLNILEKFKKNNNKLSFIISIHTLDECIDIPECDSIYMLNKVINPINIIQRISRCMRKMDNKIKSGIFLWCKKYTDLTRIANIIKNYDGSFINKILVKKINNINNIVEEKLNNESNNIDINSQKIKNIVEIILNNENINIENNNIENKLYTCEHCDRQFKNKKNLIYHTSQDVCSKNINVIKKNNKYTCSICNKDYTHLRCLRYHLANKKLNCNLTSKSNNNINNINNINNLVPFRNTPFDIDLTKMKDCFENPLSAINKIINNIHFNQDNPQNMNIINSNRRDDSVKVYDYNSENELCWITQNKYATCELLHNKSVNTMIKIPPRLKAKGYKLDPQKEFRLTAHIGYLEHDRATIRESINKIKNLTYDNHKKLLNNKNKLNLSD